MKYQVTISNAFDCTIGAIMDDAAFYSKVPGDEHYDEYLARLSKVANAPVVKTTKAGATLELDEEGIKVLREEAVYRMEWANENAALEWGGDRMAWFATARSAKAMIARIDKVTA